MRARIAKHLSRKLLVSVAMLGLVAGLGAITQAQSRQHYGGDPLVGTWLFTVVPDDGSPAFIVYETYSDIGAVTAIDNQAPSSQETTAIGNWRKVGSRDISKTNGNSCMTPVEISSAPGSVKSKT